MENKDAGRGFELSAEGGGERTGYLAAGGHLRLNLVLVITSS